MMSPCVEGSAATEDKSDAADAPVTEGRSCEDVTENDIDGVFYSDASPSLPFVDMSMSTEPESNTGVEGTLSAEDDTENEIGYTDQYVSFPAMTSEGLSSTGTGSRIDPKGGLPPRDIISPTTVQLRKRCLDENDEDDMESTHVVQHETKFVTKHRAIAVDWTRDERVLALRYDLEQAQQQLESLKMDAHASLSPLNMTTVEDAVSEIFSLRQQLSDTLVELRKAVTEADTSKVQYESLELEWADANNEREDALLERDQALVQRDQALLKCDDQATTILRLNSQLLEFLSSSSSLERTLAEAQAEAQRLRDEGMQQWTLVADLRKQLEEKLHEIENLRTAMDHESNELRNTQTNCDQSSAALARLHKEIEELKKTHAEEIASLTADIQRVHERAQASEETAVQHQSLSSELEQVKAAYQALHDRWTVWREALHNAHHTVQTELHKYQEGWKECNNALKHATVAKATTEAEVNALKQACDDMETTHSKELKYLENEAKHLKSIIAESEQVEGAQAPNSTKKQCRFDDGEKQPSEKRVYERKDIREHNSAGGLAECGRVESPDSMSVDRDQQSQPESTTSRKPSVRPSRPVSSRAHLTQRHSRLPVMTGKQYIEAFETGRKLNPQTFCSPFERSPRPRQAPCHKASGTSRGRSPAVEEQSTGTRENAGTESGAGRRSGHKYRSSFGSHPPRTLEDSTLRKFSVRNTDDSTSRKPSGRSEHGRRVTPSPPRSADKDKHWRSGGSSDASMEDISG